MLGDPNFKLMALERISWEGDINDYPYIIARRIQLPLLSFVFRSLPNVQQITSDIVERGITTNDVMNVMRAESFEEAWRRVHNCFMNPLRIVEIYFDQENECSGLLSFHAVGHIQLSEEYFALVFAHA